MREIGRLSDDWVGHWVVLNCGLIGSVSRYMEVSGYPWKVGSREYWSLTTLGEYLIDEPFHKNSINWKATANLTDQLLSMLESMHPDSAVMLGPFRDHIEETAS